MFCVWKVLECIYFSVPCMWSAHEGQMMYPLGLQFQTVVSCHVHTGSPPPTTPTLQVSLETLATGKPCLRKQKLFGGWRGGSVVKSVFCFCRGLGLGSQHLQWPIVLVSGYLTLSEPPSALVGMQVACEGMVVSHVSNVFRTHTPSC